MRFSGRSPLIRKSIPRGTEGWDGEGGTDLPRRVEERVTTSGRGGLRGLRRRERFRPVPALVGEHRERLAREVDPYPRFGRAVLGEADVRGGFVQVPLRLVEVAGVDAGPGRAGGVLGGQCVQGSEEAFADVALLQFQNAVCPLMAAFSNFTCSP